MHPGTPDVPEVQPAEAERLVADGALLIDVREQAEWDEARIPGAELRPMSAIETWYSELPQDRIVIVYCRSGSRSAHVVKALTEQAGFTDVHNLAGGIIAWDEAQLPIER